MHSNASRSHVHAANGIRRDGGCPETPVSDQRCLWCNRVVIQARRHGSLKRFCCAGHRNAFWTAARRWVMRAVEAGFTPGPGTQGPPAKRARFRSGRSDRWGRPASSLSNSSPSPNSVSNSLSIRIRDDISAGYAATRHDRPRVERQQAHRARTPTRRIRPRSLRS